MGFLDEIAALTPVPAGGATPPDRWDRHLARLSRNDRQDACPTTSAGDMPPNS
jgi:hypothetical protein